MYFKIISLLINEYLLSSDVLELILEFDGLGHGDTVLCYLGRPPGRFNNDIPTLEIKVRFSKQVKLKHEFVSWNGQSSSLEPAPPHLML